MIHFFNTLTREKQEFIPSAGNEVKMFVCGPTVYDEPHLGHAKTYTQFDFVARYLAYRGFRVDYLQNITDIDDKILNRARERDCDWRELARKYEQSYLEEMRLLGNTSVTRYARATDYISDIIRQVSVLVDQGNAYVAEDGVYFDTSTFGLFGHLARRTHVAADDAQSRIDAGGAKRSWNDFCLWKFSKAGEPVWPAPFGEGRPGWHVEDTAISEHELGVNHDLHGGAVDLIFPHHECEIAIMESYSGRSPFVRFWLHTGFLMLQDEKMAKGTGNFLTIRELRERFSPRALRYFFLSSHYRAPVSFSFESVENSARDLRKLDELAHRLEPERDDADCGELVESTRAAIVERLDDDLDVPGALTSLQGWIKQMNREGKTPGRRVSSFLSELDQVFGFILAPAGRENSQKDEIEALIRQRDQHRQEKRFAEADAIRDELLRRKVKLYDSPEGAKWRIED